MERADKVEAMTDKIGEPSMEEILASIRKIIAEEPQGSAPDRRAVNPLLAGTERRSDSGEAPLPFSDRPPPSLDRLSSALKPDPVPPREQAASSRASPLDDDLADLLDDHPGALPPVPFGIKVTATTDDESDEPAPSAERSPAATASAPPAPPASSASASSAPAEPALDEAPVSPSPAIEPAPMVVTPPVSAMPPLRKTGFYPPQRKLDQQSNTQRATFAPATSAPAVAPAAAAWNGTGSSSPPVANGRAAGHAPTPSPSPLDTLAAGLAAAALSESATPPSSQPVPLVPLSASETAQASSPAVRSLEDVITDMLKPMLQQWLADNMPRIIERALRVEAANGVNSQDKPPTSR
jgi:cell pole-organizing protein PopZ